MKVLLLILFLPLLALQGCKEDSNAEASNDAALNPNVLTIQTQAGEALKFNVELAISPSQQAQGLMNRQSMPQESGMLFIFPNSAERRFWMKNTFIPLDIIYVRADGIIHHIHRNAVPLDPTGIPSKGAVMAVFEVNAGLSNKLGIRAGDKIIHPAFKS